MIKRIVLTSIALAIFAAAPALAQCTKGKATQDKPCCAKGQQAQDEKKACVKDANGCKAACSKDCKECKIACPACGKEMTLTLAEDGKSCSGTCAACGKVVTKECKPGDCKGKDGKACGAGKDAKSGCASATTCTAGQKAGCASAATCSAGQKAGCASATTCTAGKAVDAGCAKGDGKAGCGDTNCAGEMVRYKGTPVPRMVYQVGDQRMTCARSCAALAAEQNAKIQYVVNGKVYDEKQDALAAYADVLDEFLSDLFTVKHDADAESSSYQLASFAFDGEDASEQAVKQAHQAIDEVKMVVMVGDQKFECPVEAAKVAKDQGKEVDYCCGTLRTTSETVARIQLISEKIKLAIDTFEKCGGKPI